MKPVALVVDDNPVNRKVLDAMLSKRAHVQFANDGLEALERLEESPPDIVFLDIMMPNMDGFGVIDALLAQGRGDIVKRTVVVTAKVGDGTRERVTELGAAAFLPKPVMLTAVEETFREIISRSSPNDDAEVGAA